MKNDLANHPFPTGVGVALVTPFTAGNEVDNSGAARLAKRLREKGIRHFIVSGTTGEASSLETEERVSLLATIRRAIPDAFITVGITGPTIARVLDDANASAPWADGFLLAPPPYVKPPQWELIRFVQKIADEVTSPICLYHVPGRSAVGFSLETIDELANHPRVGGLKYADSSLVQLSRIHGINRGRLTILSGEDALYLPMLAAGAHGIISVGAHIVPRTLIELTEQFAKGHHGEALDAFTRILPTLEACFRWTNPIPVKLWLHGLGLLESPTMRSPLGLPDPPETQRLSEELLQLTDDWRHDAELAIAVNTA